MVDKVSRKFLRCGKIFSKGHYAIKYPILFGFYPKPNIIREHYLYP